MKKKFLFILVSLLFVIPNVNAVNYHNYGVTKNEEKLIQEEEKRKGFIKDLKYRFVEKDTHDTLDYTYLTVIILLMTIIIISLNKKTYVSFRDHSVFEDKKFLQSKGL